LGGFPARVSFFLLGPLIFSIACGSGGAKSTPTEVPTPADAAAIRKVDFSQVGPLQTLVRQVGGTFDPKTALYADLTGDGREEAVLPLSSGGTLGNIAYQVYTLREGAPALILTSTRDPSSAGGLVMNIEDGKLVRSVGRYGPEDPRCCPSALLKTFYRWDGKDLQVEREQEVKSTPGPKAKD
jgi:hypothetical protein